MTQTISRIYQSPDKADTAATQLKKAGFAPRAVNVVARSEKTHDQVLSSLRRAGVTGPHADHYVEAIGRGETVVAVQAPFGTAAVATAILERHGPSETGLGEQGYDKPPPDPAAPFSSACGWTVLINNPAPLSSALGWSILSTSRKPRKAHIDLVDNPAPLSAAIDAPVLTHRPAILSSRFGWRTLWDNAAPLSTRFRWPVLTQDQNLPPKRFGVPLLKHDPAPLSGRVGWKLLSNDPAPLSRLLGWRVLSEERHQAGGARGGSMRRN